MLGKKPGSMAPMSSPGAPFRIDGGNRGLRVAVAVSNWPERRENEENDVSRNKRVLACRYRFGWQLRDCATGKRLCLQSARRLIIVYEIILH